MNSASRGLRPTVGLRRPGRCLLRRRRPTLGAERLGRPISIGVKAFGRRSACGPNEFGLPGPSANGRPAPTGGLSFASAEADAWRAAPWKADFNRREGLRPAVGLRRPRKTLCVGGGRRLARSALEGRFRSAWKPAPTGKVPFASAEADAWRAAPWKADFNRREGLRPAVGLRRPGGAFCVGEGRRLARKRLGRPISIGVKAFGRRSACGPNEFGLPGPSANGRPAPTGEVSFASAEADAWRAALWKADFDRRGSLRRPGRCLLRRRRPTPGAQRPGRPISIGVEACADRGGVFCVGGGRRLARSALEGRFQSA
jgi:hypothetical protein